MPSWLEDSWLKIKDTFSKESLSGCYNIQFIIPKSTNEIIFTDLNPRIGTSCQYSKVFSCSMINNGLSKTKHSLEDTNINHDVVIRNLSSNKIPKLDISSIDNFVFDLDDTLISNRSFINERCKQLYHQDRNLKNKTDLLSFLKQINFI